eukprot:scaffold106532_cov45-Phaeocystis_antarctica.AAC.1
MVRVGVRIGVGVGVRVRVRKMVTAGAQLAPLHDAHVARVAVVRHHLALLPLALPLARLVGVAARHLHPSALDLLQPRAAGRATRRSSSLQRCRAARRRRGIA